MNEELTTWERTSCSRCGGSGHYSFCTMYGTTCFKCGGKGTVLTKRAAAAVAWLKQQRQTPVSELRVGMKIRVDMGIGQFRTKAITAIEPSKSCAVTVIDGVEQRRYYTNVCVNGMTLGVFPESLVEVIPDTEEKRLEQVRAGIAYQNQLTKAGKPRKAPAITCDNCGERCTATVDDSTLLTGNGPDERAFRWGVDCRCGKSRGDL